MSDMEALYGKFRKSDVQLQDGEDAYDAGERLGLDLVDVDGQLYEIETIKELESYGFSLLIEPSDEHRFMCLWYNGGAGMHEVVEEIIRKSLKGAAQ